jgi:hypothetical protein
MKEFFENKQVGFESMDLDLHRDLAHYLRLTETWVDPFPPLVVKQVDGFNIIDESESTVVGAKARFGSLLISQVKEKELVYVAPRFGMAAISIAYLASIYGKKVTLFMPAAKEVSEHQLVAIEMGCRPIFRKIAAMPVLNGYANKYARDNGAFFIPLGLKHELVTAVAVRVIHDFFSDVEHPANMWSVISTGVLTRALQIALPKTNFHAVAVARNIQQGELGRAKFYSYSKPFSAKSGYIPQEFDCADNYDAKGYHIMRTFGKPGDYFFNVAGNIAPAKLRPSEVDSQRAWREVRD